jgi:hypothetical protein
VLNVEVKGIHETDEVAINRKAKASSRSTANLYPSSNLRFFASRYDIHPPISYKRPLAPQFRIVN